MLQLEIDGCVRHAAEIAELVARIHLEARACLCGRCFQQPCTCALDLDPDWIDRMLRDGGVL